VRRIAVSTYAASLYLYPASFRDEYGHEMRRLLADSLRGAGSGGEAALVWLQAMAGVLLEAPREHGWLILNDLRYAFRTLRHARWFTLTALFTLALGIGANSAIFSVVETLLLRQLPYRDPDRIVMVWVKNPEQGFDHDVTSYPRLEDWRAQSSTIEAFAAYYGARRVLTELSDSETFVKGEGRYTQRGRAMPFTYSCAVDVKSGAASGVVFRETGDGGPQVAQTPLAGLASLDPAACESATARALADKNPRAGRIVFNADKRTLRAVTDARTGLEGEGAMVRAPGMYAERFTYLCVYSPNGNRIETVQTSD